MAAEVGLSASACHRRIKALEEAGIIQSYRAVIDARSLGLPMTFFIEVVLASQTEAALDAFEASVANVPEILECHLMAGDADYLLRVACQDSEDFERIHRRIVSKLPKLARVRSIMSIRTVKFLKGIPI